MESVSKSAESILDHSILERFPLFLEHFIFLKKRVLIFWNAFLSICFWKIFHWEGARKFPMNSESDSRYTTEPSYNCLFNLR